MIRVKAGPLYHYGIYVSDDEVIQFGPNPVLRLEIPDSQLSVCATNIEEFLCGEFLEVASPERAERKKLRKPGQVVELARSRVGEKGYHILHNNCEHFANECYCGEKRSAQTDGIRALFQNMNVVDLYTAALPDGPVGEVYPPQRQEQLEQTGHEGLRKQRYYVWKLLEYGVHRSLGLKIQDLHFHRDDRGKWSCRECFFSLSHTDGVVAVAVSKKPVGVDIEALDRPVNPKLGDKILTASEKLQQTTERYLLEKWCAKESLFKMGSEPVFHPERIETDKNVAVRELSLGEEAYLCAVASADIKKLRCYENILL